MSHPCTLRRNPRSRQHWCRGIGFREEPWFQNYSFTKSKMVEDPEKELEFKVQGLGLTVVQPPCTATGTLLPGVFCPEAALRFGFEDLWIKVSRAASHLV